MFTLALYASKDTFSRRASLSRSRFQDCVFTSYCSPILYTWLTKIPAFLPIFINSYLLWIHIFIVSGVPFSIFLSGKSLITIHEPAQVLPLLGRFFEPSLPYIKIRSFPFSVFIFCTVPLLRHLSLCDYLFIYYCLPDKNVSFSRASFQTIFLLLLQIHDQHSI